MKPNLHSIHSPDLRDMQTSSPKDPEHFQILVQAMIGPDNSAGQESFDFIVCTPSRIAEVVSKKGYFVPVHHLVVERYDYFTIRNAIAELCETIFGTEWKDVADKLRKYGAWEFENYI